MSIFGKFGAPAMGVVGAAVGTLVSRVIMVIYLWFLLYSTSLELRSPTQSPTAPMQHPPTAHTVNDEV